MAGRACMAGGMHDKGVCVAGGMCGRREGHCSERYASYWNAFLYVEMFIHTGRRQGQGLGPILSYCASLVPYTGPGSIECE